MNFRILSSEVHPLQSYFFFSFLGKGRVYHFTRHINSNNSLQEVLYSVIVPRRVTRYLVEAENELNFPAGFHWVSPSVLMPCGTY